MPGLIEIGQVVLQFILIISKLSPLGEGMALHLHKLESLSPNYFVPILVEIGPVILEKKMKM